MSRSFISLPYASIVNALPQPAFIIGPDLMIEEANARAVNLFGLDMAEVRGMSLNRFMSLPADDGQLASHILDLSLTENYLPTRAKAWLPNGDSITVDVIFTSFAEGVFLAVLNVVSTNGGDISLHTKPSIPETEEAQVEEVRRRVAELELLNCQLQDTIDQSKKSTDERAKFVSLVSHQLRSPLAALLGLAELLQVSGTQDEEQAQLTSAVTEAANAALNRLNTLVEWSDLEAGRIKIEPKLFDPSSLTHECVNACFDAARAKRIVLTCAVNQPQTGKVLGDDRRILRTLNIMVETIIGFTNGGEISVNYLLEPRTPQNVRATFFVKGAQPAMSDEALQAVFEVAQKTPSDEGWMGLSLCKGLADLMGGTISTERTADGSVVYSFSLQLAMEEIIDHSRLEEGDPNAGPNSRIHPQDHDERSGLANSASTTRKRILVVEDNPILQKVVVKQLSSFGFDVTAVSTGHQAVEVFKERRFDLILMDCLLPEMDGFEATMVIREEEKALGYRTPIIAMTAGLARGDRERCVKAGMDDYLRKPVGLETIRQKIHQWCVKPKR